ncbi:hypothetical protein LCGC14_0583430 [marine sediment metagenome]|uniref:Phage terminase small subunit P27 family n=1 Tax=marine sediment metagenome TaxID=412755 RepID=A0A0F9UP16_9ZZZZ
MTRGRKPQSARQKKLAGNPGKRPLNVREPEPERGLPEPPKSMSPRVVEVYQMLGGLLDGMGVMTLADGVALQVAAYSYVQWERTAQWMTASLSQEIIGDIQATPKERAEWVRSPMAVAHKHNIKALRDSLTELGLNPTARTRLMTTGPDDKESREEMQLRPYREDVG